MKRTKRKARYYQNGGLQGVVNSAKSATIKAPSSFSSSNNTASNFGIQSGGFGAGNSGGFKNASLGIDTSLNGDSSSKDFNLGDIFSEGSTAYGIASGVAGLLPRAIATLHDYSKSLNLFGEKDDLDIQLENMTKDARQKANAINFKGSNASLNTQSTEMPLIDSATADDFGGYKNEWTTGLEGAGKGAMASSGLGWQGALIGGSIDAIFRGGAATNRNARLGKNNWLTRNTSPWQHLGWALGMPITGNFLGVLAGDSVADRMKDRNVVDAFNKEAQNLNTQIMNKFNYAVKDADTTNDLWRLQNMYNTNYAAFGGLLETNGSNWKTGASYIENGGTHEMNPNDGVQYGIASDGLPNLVEEGEVVIKTRDNAEGRPTYSDYVLSNRVKPTLDEIINANITKKPEKYEGKSWAEIYKDLTKSYNIKEIVNRQDTKDYLDSLHDRISKAQEESRLREQQEQIMKRLKKASPEEKDVLLQQASYPSPLEEAMYACGGKLYQDGGNIPTGTRQAGGYSYAPFYDQYEAWLASQPIIQPQSIGYTYQPSATELELNATVNAIKEDQAKQDFYNRWVGTGKDKKGKYWYYTNHPETKYYEEKPTLAEVDATVADMGYADTYASGGSIHITPSKKGTFTAAATKHGMGVQEFASRVLANKEDYSPAMVKKANFARNAAHWHQLGGPTYEDYSSPYYGLQVLDTGNTEPIVLNVPTQDSFLDLVRTSQPSQNEGPWNIDEDSPRTKLIRSASKPEGYNYTTAYTSTSTPIEEDYYSSLKSMAEAEKLAKELNTSKPDRETRRRIDFNNLPGLDKEMLLPITSGLNVLTDALGVTNIADYSNADRFGRAILPPTLIGYNPNGRYVKPLLTDPRYVSSKLANQSNAAIAAARDLSGSNRATALANIALNNYLNNQAIGQSLAQTDAANNAAIRDAVRINNEIDRANAQGMLTADQANQSELERYASRYAHQKNLEAQLREQIDNQVNANRSANWNNFLENLQGYFDNQRNRNMANESYGRIYGYTNATDGSGRILFRDKEKKEQFAKDYGIDVRDASKVKRQVENGEEVFYLRGKKLIRKGE